MTLSESLMIFSEAVKAIRTADKWKSDDQIGYWSACVERDNCLTIHGSYYHDRDISCTISGDEWNRYRGVICDADGMVYDAVCPPEEAASFQPDDIIGILRSFFGRSIFIEQVRISRQSIFTAFRFPAR